MKVSRRSRSGKGDGKLAQVNAERIKAAGRPGTKRFVDPCKVFCGNLPYAATEDDVKSFLVEHLGHDQTICSIKVIRDWKTGNSKGYGFVLFQSPIHATSAMEVCNTSKQQLMGRTLQFHQGKRKPKENEIYVKKNKAPQDEQEAVIQEGLLEATDDNDEDDSVVELTHDDDDVCDEDLFESDDDDDDFEYDGDFEAEYPKETPELDAANMNREKRREGAKKLSRRKLPHKGFESQPELEFEEYQRSQPSWVERSQTNGAADVEENSRIEPL